MGGILKRLKPDCVFDCTVPVALELVAMTAFAHGCRVLGEKPLAPTAASDNPRSLAMVFGAIDAAKTGGWLDLHPYYELTE